MSLYYDAFKYVNMSILEIINREKRKLVDLQKEQSELQKAMANPKDLNKIATDINKLTSEVDTLEEISDFSDTNNSQNEGFEYNAEKYRESLQEETNASTGQARLFLEEKLNLITIVESKIKFQQEDNEAQEELSEPSSIFDDVD